MNDRKQEQMRLIAEQGKSRRSGRRQQEENMSDRKQEQMRLIDAQGAPRNRREEPSMVLGLMQDVAALPSTAVNVAAQFPAMAAGGLTGLVSAPFVGADKAVENMEAVRSALTPTANPTSQAQLEGLGGLLETPINFYEEKIKGGLGDTAFEATGSPAIATAFFTAPDAAIELLTAGVGGSVMRGAKAAKNASMAKAAEDLADPIKRLETESAAKHAVTPSGEVVPDRLGIELMEDGVRAADAALVTNSNLATRLTMGRMKKAKEDFEAGRTRGDSSQKIVAQEISRVAAKVNAKRKALGTKLDNVVKGSLGQTELNATPALTQFSQDIKAMGVNTKPDFDGGFETLDFDRSQLDFDSLGQARTVLNDAYKMTQAGGTATLADLHKLKRGLNQLLDSGKLEAGGSLGDVERIVADLNKNLNGVMNQVGPYKDVNAQLTKVYETLEPFNNYRPAGSGWDSSKVISEIAGVVDQSMTSSPSMIGLRDGLKAASQELASSKPLSVDVDALINWHQDMGALFNVTEQSVLDAMERIAKSQKQAVASGSASASVGNTFGLVHDGAKLVANGAKKKEVKTALQRLRRVNKNVDDALARTSVKTTHSK